MKWNKASIAAASVIAAAVLASGGVFGQQPSAIVYPERPAGLRVNHALAEHAALACESCHVKTGRSGSARDNLLPPESACEPCHADRLDRARASREKCGSCHQGFDPAKSSAVPAAAAPAARIHFSHARHGGRGVRCADCHGEIGKAASGAAPHLPSMRDCMRCHRVEERRYACATCHWSTPAGLVRRDYPEGDLKPPSWLLGMGHDKEWVVRHRWAAADRGAVCASCHQESECTRCHDGSRRPSAVHPNDWLKLHAQQSRRGSPRCAGCHTEQRFCAECHARLGISQSAAPDARSGARHHPPVGEWTRGPNRHAKEAKRSLSSCVSCHAERDCVRCHAQGGERPAASPHPSGFANNCGKLLRANPRACRACHGNTNYLSDRCR